MRIFLFRGGWKDSRFIMFLAVDSKLRSKGCGSLMLKEIQSLYPENKVIVSIERCDKTVENLEQRLRTQKVLREEWIPLYRMPVGAFEGAAGGSGKKRGI